MVASSLSSSSAIPMSTCQMMIERSRREGGMKGKKQDPSNNNLS